MTQIQTLNSLTNIPESESCQTNGSNETASNVKGLLYYRCALNPIEETARSPLSPHSISRIQDTSVSQDSLRYVKTPGSPKVGKHSKARFKSKTDNFLNPLSDDGDEDVDNSVAVARLAKDFDLMFSDASDQTIDPHSASITSKRCCVQRYTDRCSRFLEITCLCLSIITSIVSFLLAVQTITVQQFGSSILCLVGSLVFLFLIFLQKKGLHPGTAVGCVIASLSVAALCLGVLAVWAHDLVLLLSTRASAPSQNASMIVDSPPTLVDVVEAKLFPNPQLQLWGCFPPASPVLEEGQEYPTIAIQDLSVGCLISQTLLGVLSSISTLSSMGVAIVASWMCVRLYKQHRELKNATNVVCPTRLQRTTSTPLKTGKPNI